MPDFDSMSLTEIYKLDADERIKTLNKHILSLEREPSNQELIEDTMREAHSLKAASRIVNHPEVQALSHKMEEFFINLQNEKKDFPSEVSDLILKILDSLETSVSEFVEEKPSSINVDVWGARLDAAKEGKVESFQQADVAQEVAQEAPNVIPLETVRKETISKEPKQQKTTVRIGTDKLDNLINLSGEIYTNVLNLDRNTSSLRAFSSYFVQLLSAFDQFSSNLRQEEIESPKVKELLVKNEAMIRKLQEMFSSYFETTSRVSLNFVHLGSQLQDEVMQSRMLSASTLFEPYERYVRDAARETGKVINLELEGAETQIDRNIIELLKDPLTHLIRNACDHGIESLAERSKAGKPEAATLKISAIHQADRVIVTVEDDGRGINEAKIVQKVKEKGLIPSEKLNQLARGELLNFIFLHGFSTSDKVTTTSGRGVGLDVVKSSLNQVGGNIQVETENKKFTRFILSLPLTLTVTKTLLVEVGGEKFCFPLTRIEGVHQIDQSVIQTIQGKEAVNIHDEMVPIVHLGALWSLSTEKDISEKKDLLLLGDSTFKIALCVDRFLEEKEVVTKSLDRRLGWLADLSGGTILDNGQVAYVVNIDSVLRSISDYKGQGITQEQIHKLEKRKKILVVEDSLTVRELEKTVLKNQGFEVETAMDGMDAFNKLKEAHFDLVVTDVEMPRMNGLELIGVMKKETVLAAIPTIIVSYRESEQDKRKGLDVGADRYLVKSKYDNKTLLSAIDELIGA